MTSSSIKMAPTAAPLLQDAVAQRASSDVKMCWVVRGARASCPLRSGRARTSSRAAKPSTNPVAKPASDHSSTAGYSQGNCQRSARNPMTMAPTTHKGRAKRRLQLGIVAVIQAKRRFNAQCHEVKREPVHVVDGGQEQQAAHQPFPGRPAGRKLKETGSCGVGMVWTAFRWEDLKGSLTDRDSIAKQIAAPNTTQTGMSGLRVGVCPDVGRTGVGYFDFGFSRSLGLVRGIDRFSQECWHRRGT